MDHARNPRNKGELSDADVTQQGDNPSCGDILTLYLKYDDGVIANASFEGEGCAVSTAAASLLTEKLKRMNKEEVAKLTEKDMYEMLKVEIHGSRKKCALLPLYTLRDAVRGNTN
jgi:nitrogen fixation NifU-like protein